MDYSQQIQNARTKFAIKINEALPNGYQVNPVVFENIIEAIAFFLWYHTTLPSDEAYHIQFSKDYAPRTSGTLRVTTFSLALRAPDEFEWLRDILKNVDVCEFSSANEEEIDIDFTYHDLYIPLVRS